MQRTPGRGSASPQDSSGVWSGRIRCAFSVVSSGAEVFVTGDRELLGAGDQVEGIQFLSPRDFWQLLSA